MTADEEKQVVAIVSIGYSKFVVPLSILEQIASMSKVEERYDGGDVGYVYWYSTDKKCLAVELIQRDRILLEKPEEKPKEKPVAKVPRPDDRLFAGSTQPPIIVGSVPPMREFVNEYRDGENP